MSKITIRLFQILTVVLTILLIFSTFVPQRSEFAEGVYPFNSNWFVRVFQLDHFYTSQIHIGLWILVIVLLLLSVFTNVIKSRNKKFLHLLLALIFIVVIYDKSTNKRFFISIIEGETVRFSEFVQYPAERENVAIRLDKFEIQQHPGSMTPKAFISHLNINGKKDALSINKPLAIGRYRLFQNAYDQKLYFELSVNEITRQMTFGDTVKVEGKTIALVTIDQDSQQFLLSVNDIEYRVPVSQTVNVNGQAIRIQPAGLRYVSIIEVAQVKGARLLLILGILYIIPLVFTFWRKSPKPGKLKG